MFTKLKQVGLRPPHLEKKIQSGLKKIELDISLYLR